MKTLKKEEITKKKKLMSIIQLTETLVWPNDSAFHTSNGITCKPENIGPKLGQLIADGYEIYQAIEFHTSNCAGIKYILRKEI